MRNSFRLCCQEECRKSHSGKYTRKVVPDFWAKVKYAGALNPEKRVQEKNTVAHYCFNQQKRFTEISNKKHNLNTNCRNRKSSNGHTKPPFTGQIHTQSGHFGTKYRKNITNGQFKALTRNFALLLTGTMIYYI